VLVVEGPKDDEWFFKALARHLGLLEAIQIIPIYGKTNLRDRLKAIHSASRQDEATEIISLGVVRDADENPAAAFQSVRDALRDAGFPVPEHALTPAGEHPRVTVLILPNEQTPGMVEDFCLKAVENDNARICVEQYFQCLQQQGLSLPRNMSKARVQAFLASKPEPGKRLGEAAEAGYWPWDDQAFDEAKIFLEQICSA
jgi:hypothetical protein